MDVIALAVAAYMRYMMGADEEGEPIAIKDPLSAKLHPLLWKVFCSNRSSKQFVLTVFGPEVAESDSFVQVSTSAENGRYWFRPTFHGTLQPRSLRTRAPG